MTKTMLIDATHEEETRVAAVDGNRLVEFEYESKYRKPLKGSIFLAKVTRVEPSLQAAFVNFGGNRHGFLPFSEIHPDYFRIPIADREALIAEQEAAMAEDEEDEEDEDNEAQDDAPDHTGADSESEVELKEEPGAGVVEEIGGGEEQGADAPAQDAAPAAEKADETGGAFADEDDDGPQPGNMKGPEDFLADPEAEEEHAEHDVNGNVVGAGGEDREPGEGEQDGRGDRGGRDGGRGGRRGGRGRHRRGGAQHRSKRPEKYSDEEKDGENSGGGRFSLRRKYKIQEVIKRGQIMLVQVSKEERGNKGAAVSSYLSLPGRYCVLMPNSPRGGGVSRKISNYQDRAKMREIMKDLEVPKGMSVIVRTAGVSRTKAEVKRDLDYLMRLWDNIRELTLQSSAPAIVYEEANLIKRAVRDLYDRDVDEIHVAGEEGYKQARDFMKMMIPSHVKKVVQYKDEVPLFTKHRIEDQIAEIGEPLVTLPSGGYLVINPTEALISIDVNSGKSTKERHIEETATRTNLEAAEEVARQLRMRDLGGLIVIDFIDMEDRRNNAKVERKMRESLSGDRARIQMGRISSFGLMELSRQRMNPSLTESQYETCTRCSGLGRVRTADATSIMAMRAIEDEGIKRRASQVNAYVSNAVAIYILNYKRKHLTEIEARYGFSVMIRVDETVGVSGYRVEVSRPVASAQDGEPGDEQDDDKPDQPQGSSPVATAGEEGSREGQRPRRRGRRGGRGRRRGGSERGERTEGEQDSRAGHQDHNGHDHAAESQDFSGESGSDDSESSADVSGNDFAESTPAPSNDDAAPKPLVAERRPARAPREEQEDRPKDYEKVNETDGEKKKGWWSRK